MYCRDKQSIHQDSSSETYRSLDSNEDVDDYQEEQEAINKNS